MAAGDSPGSPTEKKKGGTLAAICPLEERGVKVPPVSSSADNPTHPSGQPWNGPHAIMHPLTMQLLGCMCKRKWCCHVSEVEPVWSLYIDPPGKYCG